MTIWSAWGQEWALFDKVTFDGINKIIFVHPEVTVLDIRDDVYSSWIDWLTIDDNIKFTQAMRTTGYDPIGSGIFTGDLYFLVNGWRLSVNLQKVRINGVLFSEDYDSAFFTTDMQIQFPATVSSLVTTVSTGGGGSGPTAQQIRREIDNNSNKLMTLVNSVNALPSAATNRLEMESNSSKLSQIKILLDSMEVPTASENANAVWSKPIVDMSDKTTIGGYITKALLSVPKFLGLK